MDVFWTGSSDEGEMIGRDMAETFERGDITNVGFIGIR